MKNMLKIGEKVVVTEEGLEAEVLRIFENGDIEVRFLDGEEGSYNTSEVKPY